MVLDFEFWNNLEEHNMKRITDVIETYCRNKEIQLKKQKTNGTQKNEKN